jgi:V/A-type H+-transporting ATPase subunit D
MALLRIAPTKSNLLALGRQLAFAEEGYDLLEQKRQILMAELMNRLKRARAVEQRVEAAMEPAFAALREATLRGGAAALERTALAVPTGQRVDLDDQHVMGLHLPRVTARIEPAEARFGVGGTPAAADEAMRRFVNVLPDLAELAELENAILRLARELRKTQRRCNALLKIFIPDYRETIVYIRASLEERERESFVILRMIRDRLAQSVG